MAIEKGKSGEVIPEEVQKKILVELMDLIMERCEKLSIKCMLIWGTLLGAVRHHGFIPWDDDIDVMMKRDEYEVFKESILNEPLADNVRFTDHDYPISKFNPNRVGKIGRSDTVIHYEGYGKKYENILAVDVFAMDIVPSIDDGYYDFVKECHETVDEINRIIYIPSKDKGFLHRMISSILKKIRYAKNYKRLQKKRTEQALRFKGMNTGFVGFPDNFDGGGVILPAEAVRDVTKLSFEGKEYYVPIGYDEILRITYGDYMQLPPEEQRKSRHDYKDTLWR